MDVSLTLLCALGTPFFQLCCVDQLQYEGFCFVLLYLVLTYLDVVSWRLALFQRGNGMDLGKKGGGEGRRSGPG